MPLSSSCRWIILITVDFNGIFFHYIGYEIVGFENIPREGPALLIYYHGTIPIDFYYVMAKTLLEKNRHIRAVGDRFLFHIPGEQDIILQNYVILVQCVIFHLLRKCL